MKRGMRVARVLCVEQVRALELAAEHGRAVPLADQRKRTSSLTIPRRFFWRNRSLAELADLIRMMNSYCSNLIEGYNTRLSTSSARSAMVHSKTSSRVCQTFRFIQTAFGSVKLSIAAVPWSRPKPQLRQTPQGRR